jgi:hypothetical protein
MDVVDYFDKRMKRKDENARKIGRRMFAVDVVFQCIAADGRAKNQHYFDYGR